MGVQQDLVAPSRLIAEESWGPSPPTNPWFIGYPRWNKAEKAAEGIISKLRPTIVAERKRDSVINYLQNLLQDNLDCEVFAYGSVPLKTYLPDGDIDLSAVTRRDDLVKDILALLRSKVKNSSAEFIINDVQLIGRAEVKIVKCMVQNLVVDISVNMVGGLSTLCFLEQVDRVIKKDHLFKRSIILIKAWCYFESRTLGAHAGLISTYGLETLVLYIFHVFHIILDGPLSVLYKFLEYFSKFDWDNFGISLMGPIRLSALPTVKPERPPNRNDLLLKIGFLRHCSDTLSIPGKHNDIFLKKYLNIVDPLNDFNNLGRSVSQGNLYRIRSAFALGAKKLGKILTGPEDKLTEELNSFFSNTLTMHGSGQRPDHIPRSPLNISEAEKPLTTRVTETLKNSNDENTYVRSDSPGNQNSNEGKDGSALVTSTEGEVRKPVRIPFYAPHLLLNYSKEVNKAENGDNVDEKKHEEGVVAPSAGENVCNDDNNKKKNEGVGDVDPSEVLDLTGNLMGHVVLLEHMQRRNFHLFMPYPMIGPPPPPSPPPGLLNMIASEHGGGPRRPPFQPRDQMFMLPRPPFPPNDPNSRAHMTYFPDMHRSRHGHHTSTSNTTNTGPPIPAEGISGFAPANRPTPPQTQREPFAHRRRQPNPNRARQPETTPRPRSVSGTDRFAVQTAYHLKDDEDFPPLSS